MSKKWKHLSPKEREDYVNQDECKQEHFIPPIPVNHYLEQNVPDAVLAELIDPYSTDGDLLNTEIFKCLTPLEKSVAQLYYGENYSLRAVASKVFITTEVCGVEAERVHVTFRKIKSILKRVKKKLGKIRKVPDTTVAEVH